MLAGRGDSRRTVPPGKVWNNEISDIYDGGLLPKALHDSFGLPPQKLPRITTSHEMNWVEAAKGKTEASARGSRVTLRPPQPRR